MVGGTFTAVALGCLAVTCTVTLHAQARSVPPAAALEEVLVTGERPGPGMWRVSKNGHDLWILATLEPLPKGMTWRSDVVDTRIAAAQVVLAPPRVSADVGFFRSLTLVPSLLRARKRPDGATLEQALPHDMYMRWLALRVKYLDASDEPIRPILAAIDVYQHALDRSGLTADDPVWNFVEKTAHRHHVAVLPVTVTLPVPDPKRLIREFDNIPLTAELDCLDATLTRLETDLQPMRRRANLWSLGDIAGLKALPPPNQRLICLNAIYSVPQLRDKFEHAEAQAMNLWVDTAYAALETHATSVAVLSLSDLLDQDGRLARLRARGCLVEEPT